MRRRRRQPIPERPPVVLPPCRGCNAAPSMETLLFVGGHVQCGVCGIDDPCGLFGPMRPAPTMAAEGGGLG